MIFAIWVRSWGALAACFLSGILIDLDHHLDYIIIRKKIPFRYKSLLEFCHVDHTHPIYLLLHSYELLLLLWVSVFLFDLGVIWMGAAVGFTAHIFCDEFANPIKPMAYFLIYRAKNRFNRRAFLKRGCED